MDPREGAAQERVLCQAARAGDEAAWRVLYARAFDTLYASVRRRTGPDPQRVEDVLQETWMIAVRRLRDFDPERGSFTAWLRGISQNVLRNRWRRRPDAAQHLPAATPDDAGGDHAHPLALAEHVAMAMAGLPDRYREVLRAKYEDQLTVTEIAARGQESAKAVESLLSRARAAFRLAYRRLEPRG
jgi:RNA polymerase sigma-70 factor (ECF subfamily)